MANEASLRSLDGKALHTLLPTASIVRCGEFPGQSAARRSQTSARNSGHANGLNAVSAFHDAFLVLDGELDVRVEPAGDETLRTASAVSPA